MIIDMQLGSIYLAVCLSDCLLGTATQHSSSQHSGLRLGASSGNKSRKSKPLSGHEEWGRVKERKEGERKVTGGQRQELEYA